MTRRPFIKEAFAVLLALMLLGGWLIAPSAAHNSPNLAHNWTTHYKKMAQKIFYTKRQSNLRFVNVGETAANSSLLDGLDSAAFATSSHVHSGGDITSGTVAEARIDALIARVADVFDIVLTADGTGSTLDADLLDGQDSSAFAAAGETHTTQWFKEAADGLGSTATSERVVFTAPENLTITDVVVEPTAAVTASDTNYATITVTRRDANGTNPVTVISETTQTAISGGTGSWTTFSSVSLGPLGNTSLTSGQKLTIELTKTGLGVVLPILSIHIEYTAT